MWPKSLAITILALTFLFVQADHSDKPCVVTKTVTEGVYSDCGGWQPAKGEKMYMSGEVSKRLRVGDTFYFVWKETRWVAVIKDSVALILSPTTPAVIISRSQAEQEFKQLCIDGTDDQRLRALAAALNPMPDWAQLVMNKDPSVCNRNPKPIVLR